MGKPTGSRRKAAKAPGTKRKTRKKPCAHRHANFDTIWNGHRVAVMGCYAVWYGDDPNFGYGKYRKIFGARCVDCDVQLPLGPANDEDNSYVHQEMAAAEFARQRRIVDVAVQQGFLDHADDADPPELVGPGWRAGWLARELATHGDADAWLWDPTEPVAGQYEQLEETRRELDAQAAREEARSARNPAALVADLNAKGQAYGALNDQMDAEDEPLTAALDYDPDVEPMDREGEALTERRPMATRRPPIADILASVAAPDPDPPTDPSTKFGAQDYGYVGPVTLRAQATMLAMNGSASMVPPTAANCRLLGAPRCEHSDMTAEETQSVFGKELQDG